MIRVEITANKLDPKAHDVTIGTIIVKALKDAGVPVEASAFVLRGLARGMLNYSKSGFKHIFEFIDSDESKSVAAKFERTHSKNGVEVFKSGQHLEDEEL